VELTPCGHKSDKDRIYAAKEFKQNFKHSKQLRKLYLQTEKRKKTIIQAINQIPPYHLRLPPYHLKFYHDILLWDF
jgi:hypothetical protein